MTLEKEIAKNLIKRRETLSIAESCSGGLLSHRLTNIPGSSQFLITSIIAYNNKAKIKLLKVPPRLIKEHGAVSSPVAITMAKNARSLFHTDLGISITGIAGPAGGTKQKPVGLTFIAIATKKTHLCLKCHFKGNRQYIKKKATDQALRLLKNFS